MFAITYDMYVTVMNSTMHYDDKMNAIAEIERLENIMLAKGE